MQLSEIRIKLVENRRDRLKAFCSITFDNKFVIRDLKVIEGVNGFFVAMPSRKIADRCHTCGTKNHLRAKFCNECGKRLSDSRGKRSVKSQQKLHADIAHPINSECRELIQTDIIAEYLKEIERSKEPGYIPQNMDDYDDGYSDYEHGDSGQYHGHSVPSPSPQSDIRYKEEPADKKKNNDFSSGIL